MKLFNKQKTSFRAAAVAVLFLVASGAPAMDVVYDPANHIENIGQLMQQIKEVQEMIQLVSQQGQLLNLAQLDNLKWVIDLVQVHQQQGTLSLLQNQLGQFYQQAQDAQGATQGIYREYMASNLTWDEYIAREQRITEGNNGVHTAAFEHATETLKGLDQQYEAIRDLNARIDSAQGTQQLLQVLGKHMNLIATQEAQMLALTAQQRQEESDEKAQRDARVAKSIEAHKAVKTAGERSWGSFREALEELRSGSASQ